MRYAVGVGSNLGDRAATIAAAAALVDASGLARIETVSRFHETAPIGCPPDAGLFLNGAWIIASALGPHQVLDLLRGIEAACGRTRSVPNGRRTLDLDLLLRDDGAMVSSRVLTLPHPRLRERPFVLLPLAEIAADWPFPGTGGSVGQWAVRR